MADSGQVKKNEPKSEKVEPKCASPLEPTEAAETGQPEPQVQVNRYESTWRQQQGQAPTL